MAASGAAATAIGPPATSTPRAKPLPAIEGRPGRPFGTALPQAIDGAIDQLRAKADEQRFPQRQRRGNAHPPRQFRGFRQPSSHLAEIEPFKRQQHAAAAETGDGKRQGLGRRRQHDERFLVAHDQRIRVD